MLCYRICWWNKVVYKTPPICFSQAGGQSARKARPRNLELALTPPVRGGLVTPIGLLKPLQHVKAKATRRATSAEGWRRLASMVPPITVQLSHLGLPTVPYFPGRTVFRGLCPVSQLRSSRDAKCPVFSWSQGPIFLMRCDTNSL